MVSSPGSFLPSSSGSASLSCSQMHYFSRGPQVNHQVGEPMRECVHLCPPKGPRLGPGTSSDPVAASPGRGRGPSFTQPHADGGPGNKSGGGGGALRRRSAREAFRRCPSLREPIPAACMGCGSFSLSYPPPPNTPGKPDPGHYRHLDQILRCGGVLGAEGRLPAFLTGSHQIPAS